MSLEQALYNRWLTDVSLTALLPGERFFTGLACGEPALPYVTLNRQGVRGVRRTSQRRVEAVLVRFNLWCESLDAGKQIIAAIDARYERQAFSDGGVEVLRMRRVDYLQQRQADGVWRLTADYVASVVA